MGRHSRKQHAAHWDYLNDLDRRVAAAKTVGVPLPGQRVLHVPGREHEKPVVFRMSDGRHYAVARDGSFRRAPDGPVMRLPGGETDG